MWHVLRSQSSSLQAGEENCICRFLSWHNGPCSETAVASVCGQCCHALYWVISAESWEPGREQQLGSMQMNLSDLSVKTLLSEIQALQSWGSVVQALSNAAPCFTLSCSTQRLCRTRHRTALRGVRAGTLGCQLSHILKWVSALYTYTANSLLMI